MVLCWQQAENSVRELKTSKYLPNYNAQKVLNYLYRDEDFNYI